jgi:hypothetical protein
MSMATGLSPLASVMFPQCSLPGEFSQFAVSLQQYMTEYTVVLESPAQQQRMQQQATRGVIGLIVDTADGRLVSSQVYAGHVHGLPINIANGLQWDSSSPKRLQIQPGDGIGFDSGTGAVKVAAGGGLGLVGGVLEVELSLGRGLVLLSNAISMEEVNAGDHTIYYKDSNGTTQSFVVDEFGRVHLP